MWKGTFFTMNIFEMRENAFYLRSTLTVVIFQQIWCNGAYMHTCMMYSHESETRWGEVVEHYGDFLLLKNYTLSLTGPWNLPWKRNNLSLHFKLSFDFNHTPKTFRFDLRGAEAFSMLNLWIFTEFCVHFRPVKDRSAFSRLERQVEEVFEGKIEGSCPF